MEVGGGRREGREGKGRMGEKVETAQRGGVQGQGHGPCLFLSACLFLSSPRVRAQKAKASQKCKGGGGGGGVWAVQCVVPERKSV